MSKKSIMPNHKVLGVILMVIVVLIYWNSIQNRFAAIDGATSSSENLFDTLF